MIRYITIPEQLDAPKRQAHIITLKKLEAIMAQHDQAILPVVGDCLEGAGIQDGGWFAVDFTRFPKPPRYKSKGGDGSIDLCLCYATFPGTSGPIVMCKSYDGVWGAHHMVGTRYKSLWDGDKLRMNCCMMAERIFGVIFASWGRDGRLLWKRGTEEFPDKLGETTTISGEVEPV